MAHLATVSRSGKPRVSPIWFAFDSGLFYFTTRLGRVKGKHLRQNSRAALSIASDERPYRAVCAFGKVAVVDENREIWLERISLRYGQDEGKEWVANAVKQPDRAVMVLKPERILSWHYGRGDSARQDEGESMITPI